MWQKIMFTVLAVPVVLVMKSEAMSLVCVDELKLLKDIERLIKRDIPNVVINGYEPDPSIKAEPINMGRGRQQQGAKKPAGKFSNRKKTASSQNGQHPNSRGGSSNQSQSGHRARRSLQGSR